MGSDIRDRDGKKSFEFALEFGKIFLMELRCPAKNDTGAA
jgi:hypothetical protein